MKKLKATLRNDGQYRFTILSPYHLDKEEFCIIASYAKDHHNRSIPITRKEWFDLIIEMLSKSDHYLLGDDRHDYYEPDTYKEVEISCDHLFPELNKIDEEQRKKYYKERGINL